MKTLSYLFIMVILVIAGCAKDNTMFETQDNLELKKAKVPIPFKGDFYAVPDRESEILEVHLPWGGYYSLTSRVIMSGTGSFIGRIDAEKSFNEIIKIEFFLDENGDLFSEQSVFSFIVAANGDSFELTSKGKQSWVDGSYVSKDEITPGSATGRFKGATGSFETVGGWHEDGVGLWSKTEGYLVYE